MVCVRSDLSPTHRTQEKKLDPRMISVPTASSNGTDQIADAHVDLRFCCVFDIFHYTTGINAEFNY